jgi:hypothetical protein
MAINKSLAQGGHGARESIESGEGLRAAFDAGALPDGSRHRLCPVQNVVIEKKDVSGRELRGNDLGAREVLGDVSLVDPLVRVASFAVGRGDASHSAMAAWDELQRGGPVSDRVEGQPCVHAMDLVRGPSGVCVTMPWGEGGFMPAVDLPDVGELWAGYGAPSGRLGDQSRQAIEQCGEIPNGSHTLDEMAELDPAPDREALKMGRPWSEKARVFVERHFDGSRKNAEVALRERAAQDHNAVRTP